MLKVQDQLGRGELLVPIEYLLMITTLITKQCHIATERPGLKDEKLSAQHASHDVFKKPVQRDYDLTVKEGMIQGLHRLIASNTVWRFFCTVSCRPREPFESPARGVILLY